jgi:hypothetical protein
VNLKALGRVTVDGKPDLNQQLPNRLQSIRVPIDTASLPGHRSENPEGKEPNDPSVERDGDIDMRSIDIVTIGPEDWLDLRTASRIEQAKDALADDARQTPRSARK